jgi:hypothetical protein
VFEVAKGSGTITTLASFNGANGDRPYDGLYMDSAGNLYGTAEDGTGSTVNGVVFEVVGEIASGECEPADDRLGAGAIRLTSRAKPGAPSAQSTNRRITSRMTAGRLGQRSITRARSGSLGRWWGQ